MAKVVKFNIKLSIDGKEQIVTASTNVKSLARELGIARDKGEVLRDTLLRFNQLSQSFSNLVGGFQRLGGVMQGYADAYNQQEEAEVRLANVMQQRMGATEAEIKQIKDLASAQQALGVVGDEVQLMGLQQLATFSNLTGTLETLAPAMNNLLVHQRGMKGTGSDAVAVANLLGKALMGQATALQRAGITMSEAQKKTLKLGNEQQRAAVIAEVISENVGNINEELAKTDAGKAQQLSNAIGDVKEQVGALFTGMQPTIAAIGEMGLAIQAVVSISTGLMAVVRWFKALELGTKLASAATAVHTVYTRTLGTVSAATGISVTALSVAMRGLMIASGIGIAIAALSAIVGAFSDNAQTAAQYTEQFGEEATKATAKLEGLRAQLDIVSPASQTYHKTVKDLYAIYQEYGIEVKKLKDDLSNEGEVVADLTSKHDALAAAIRAESVERQKANAIQTIGNEYQTQMQNAWQQIQNAIGGDNAATITAAIKLEITDQDLQRLGGLKEEVDKLHESGMSAMEVFRHPIYKEYVTQLTDIEKRMAKVGSRFGEATDIGLRFRGGIEAIAKTAYNAGQAYHTAMQAVEEGARAVDGYSDSADRAAYANRLAGMSVAELKAEFQRLVAGYGNTEMNVRIVYEEVNVPSWMQGMDMKETRRLGEFWTKLLRDNPNAQEFTVNGDKFTRQQVAEKGAQYIKATEMKTPATPAVADYQMTTPRRVSTRGGGGGGGGGGTGTGSTGPVLTADAKTLKQLTDNVSYYEAELEKANKNDTEAVRILIEKKTAAEEALKAYQDMIDRMKGEALFDEDAETVEGINRNISILQERLETLVPNSEEYTKVSDEIQRWQDKLSQTAGGTMAYLEQRIAAINERLKTLNLSSPAAVSLVAERNALQKELDTQVGVLELRATLQMGEMPKGFAEFRKNWQQTWQQEQIEQCNKAVERQKGIFQEISNITQQIGSGFASLGQAFEEPMLNYAGILAQAVATMLQAYATASMQAAKLGPIAWATFGATGFAQVANIIAQMKQIGKFANGAIAYGPTLGLFGEYAGASHNPEVVAPLDRLRSYIAPQNGGMGGKVTFKIDGRTLVGVLEKETNYLGRM